MPTTTRQTHSTAAAADDAAGGGVAVWFDALAHTVTVDGDWPRCAGCGEYGSHEDCQPDAGSMRGTGRGLVSGVSS